MIKRIRRDGDKGEGAGGYPGKFAFGHARAGPVIKLNVVNPGRELEIDFLSRAAMGTDGAFENNFPVEGQFRALVGLDGKGVQPGLRRAEFSDPPDGIFGLGHGWSRRLMAPIEIDLRIGARRIGLGEILVFKKLGG